MLGPRLSESRSRRLLPRLARPGRLAQRAVAQVCTRKSRRLERRSAPDDWSSAAHLTPGANAWLPPERISLAAPAADAS